MQKNYLFRVMAIAMIFLFSGSWVNGQIFSEEFPTTGAIASLGWTAHSGAGTNAVTVTSGGLSMANLSNSGEAVSLTTSGEDVLKTFTPAITTGSMFATFLVNVSSSQATGDYFFHLFQGVSGTSFFPRVFVKSVSGGIDFGISKTNNTPTYIGSTFLLNTTYLVVVKYTIITGATNDTVELFVSPSINSSIEPTYLASSGTAFTDISATGFGAVGLRQGTAGNGSNLKVDRIRVATNWADAIGYTGSTTPELSSISSPSITEGNSGTTSLTFTATLTSAAVGNTIVSLSKTDISTDAADFVTVPTEVTIPNGQPSATFNVIINGDTDVESNETFTITGTLNSISKTGTGTIQDDDGIVIPTISINDVTQTEGNSGTTNFQFTVSLSAPAPVGGVTFDIATADNTATVANNDYVAHALTSQTIASGSSTYTFNVTVNGDSNGEPNETFFVNVTNIIGATASDAQGLGTITNEDITITKIHTIQGSGLTSTLLGAHTVQGVVTRVFSGAGTMNGFYVQEEDADIDADPATSEGIFVFNPPFIPAIGDIVNVAGTVIEFGTTNKLTEFSPTTSVTLISTGNPLPAVTNVTLPIANVTDWERYEGMLINVKAASGDLLVTENFELGRYGQVVLAAMDATTNQPDTDARIDQFTQFNAPSASGYSAYLAAVAKRTIYLDDSKTVQNTDPLLFGRGGMPLSASNTLRTGDAINSVTAVLDHSTDGYKLQTATPVMFTPTNPRPTSNPDVGAPTLKVGNMNVLNYFLTYAPAGRGADNATEFTRQKNKILSAILNSGLDLVSLNEIEQKDGDKGEAALIDLVAGLNSIAGAGVWNYIKPAVSTGADQITCAIIYKPAKVTPKGAAKAVYGSAFAATGRAALVQTFEQNSNLADFTVVSVHYKSKGSVIDPDILDGQGANNVTRTAQSVELRDWLADVDNGITDPDVIILGDINSYAKEDPITTLETAGYATLIPINKYSYQFDGNFGALDHALGSTSLSSQVTGALKWNINSDEPIALDYNTNFKSAGHIASLYAPDEFRSSDHDPVVVGLNLTCDDITFNETTISACDSYTWANNGETYTMSGTYTGTTTNCVTEKLVLTITPKPAEIVTEATICSNETYTWAVNGETYSSATTVTVVGENCTANKKLVLTITPKPAEIVTEATICSNETYTWAVNGVTYSSATTVTVVGENCTADKKLVLTITPKPSEIVTEVTICSNETYTWAVNGETYSSTTTVTVVGENCTADKKLVLTITPKPTEIVTEVTICSNETYTWAVNGVTYSSATTVTVVGENCTADKKLVLTITPKPTEIVTEVTICSNETYTWAVNGVTYSSATTVTVVGENCTADKKLVLTITTKPAEIVTNATICVGGTYTWAVNSQTYNSATTVTVVGVECNADQTLNLTIDNTSCSDAICTTLPADYASSTFMACTPSGSQVGVGVLMNNALNSMPKVFGLTVNNRTFTLEPTDISANIYNMMAGTSNGSSKFGLGGANYSTSSTWPRVPLTSGGQIANALFRNALALYFNLQNSTKLGDVPMTNIQHTQPLTACGALTGTGVITSYQMPTAVINYLNNSANGYPATVAGLYNLANDALGGKTGVPNLSTIATAMDKINKAFNGCRLISTPSSTPSVFGTGLKVTENNGPFNAPAKGGLFVTLIEGDAETGNILGVTEIGSDGISGFDPILNNTYKLILGTDPEGSRIPQAPGGYKIVGEKVTYFNEDPSITNSGNTSLADGEVEIGSANTNAGGKAAALTRIEVEFLLEPSSPLPVTLLTFTGKKINNSNLLEWKTANEKAFDGFEIQKSEDGKTFNKIGFAKGASKEIYQYSDNDLTATTNYYRLKMVDLDGKSTLSKIVAIQSEKEPSTIVGKIYPNPTVDKTAFVEITVDEASVWKMNTFNVLGGLQSSYEIELSKGVNKVSIELNNLSKGIYYFNLENAKGEKFVRKMIKN